MATKFSPAQVKAAHTDGHAAYAAKLSDMSEDKLFATDGTYKGSSTKEVRNLTLTRLSKLTKAAAKANEQHITWLALAWNVKPAYMLGIATGERKPATYAGNASRIAKLSAAMKAKLAPAPKPVKRTRKSTTPAVATAAA